jgi:hypothetical protein
MRRREKFVIASIVLSLGLLAMQYVPVEFRYLAVFIFSLFTYPISAWVLSDDLQRHELLTIVPMPVFFAASVGLFYFLLPTHILSKIFILVTFGVGTYALFLTSNIYSVAKGRSIQLLHAAHAIGLWFTLLTSLLFLNTIYSLKFPFWLNGLLVGLSHFPLVFLSLWSITLEPKIKAEIWQLTSLLTLLLMEFATILSFFPFAVWHVSLFIMSMLYMGLGLLHNHMRGRLFQSTLNEFTLVAVFVITVFVLLFPGK